MICKSDCDGLILAIWVSLLLFPTYTYEYIKDNLTFADFISISAIWDNRCTVHIPTSDLDDPKLGVRRGLRTISMAGKAFLDPDGSKGRKEAMLQVERVKAKEMNGNGAHEDVKANGHANGFGEVKAALGKV